MKGKKLQHSPLLFLNFCDLLKRVSYYEITIGIGKLKEWISNSNESHTPKFQELPPEYNNDGVLEKVNRDLSPSPTFSLLEKGKNTDSLLELKNVKSSEAPLEDEGINISAIRR